MASSTPNSPPRQKRLGRTLLILLFGLTGLFSLILNSFDRKTSPWVPQAQSVVNRVDFVQVLRLDQ